MAVAGAPSAAIATRSSNRRTSQFLQDENGPGDVRVERSGQACPRPRRAALCGGPSPPKLLADQIPMGIRPDMWDAAP